MALNDLEYHLVLTSMEMQPCSKTWTINFYLNQRDWSIIDTTIHKGIRICGKLNLPVAFYCDNIIIFVVHMLGLQNVISSVLA